MTTELAKQQPNLDVIHRNASYIALNELRFDWLERDIEAFEHMWRSGYTVKFIAQKLQREPEEIVILAMDRARKGKIEPRVMGLG